MNRRKKRMAIALGAGLALGATMVQQEAKAYEAVWYVGIIKGMESVPVYSSDSEKSDYLGELRGDNEFDVLEELKSGWAKIKYLGGYGYVKTKNIQSAGDLEPKIEYVSYVKGADVLRYTGDLTSVLSHYNSNAKIETYGDDVVVEQYKGGVPYKEVYRRVKITGYDKKFGYVRKKYLSKTTNNSETKATIKSDNVDVYSEASISSEVYCKLNKNENVTLLGYEDGFAKIVAGGDVGFVKKEALEEGESYKSRTIYMDRNKVESVNVYESASTNSKVIGTAYSDLARTCVFEENGFAKVKYGDGYGYVELKNWTNKRVTKKLYVGNAGKVSLRKSASSNSTLMGYVYKGDEIVDMGRKGSWVRVSQGNKSGYIPEKYVLKSKPETEYMYINTKKYLKIPVYEEASTKSRELGYAHSHKALTVLTKGKKYTIIKYAGGHGYVLNSALVEKRVVIKATVSASKATVFTGPGSNYASKGTIKKGTAVSIMGYKNSYARIKYGEEEGYVLKKNLK